LAELIRQAVDPEDETLLRAALVLLVPSGPSGRSGAPASDTADEKSGREAALTTAPRKEVWSASGLVVALRARPPLKGVAPRDAIRLGDSHARARVVRPTDRRRHL
jgi:hypothetical protein